MAKRGRPRGLNINPEAVEAFRLRECLSKQELASAVGIGPGHLADMLSDRRKGASPATVRKMAEVLGCTPGAIAPEITGRFLAVRVGDDVTDEAA